MLINRRTLFGILAAPAVIRIADLMPVKAFAMPVPRIIGTIHNVKITSANGDVCYVRGRLSGSILTLFEPPPKGSSIHFEAPMMIPISSSPMVFGINGNLGLRGIA